MDLTIKTNTGETYTISDVASVEDSKTNKVNSGGGGKYELVQDDTINLGGQTLYRIKSLKDFNDVKNGELGGYIESYSNLSQEGNSWVYGNAWVSGGAQVQDGGEYQGKCLK